MFDEPVPGGLHLRGHRPVARMVLLASRHLDVRHRRELRTRRASSPSSSSTRRARRCRRAGATSSKPWDVLEQARAPTRSAGISSRAVRRGCRRGSTGKASVDASQKLLGTLRNVYSFFAMYAEIDGYRPGADGRRRPTCSTVGFSRASTRPWRRCARQMDAYDMTRAARALQALRSRRVEQLVRAPLAAPVLEGRDGAGQDRRVPHALHGARRDAPASRAVRPVRRRGDPPGASSAR